MFTKNSAIVKSWIRLIKAGRRTYEDVPALGNLREVIAEILAEEE